MVEVFLFFIVVFALIAFMFTSKIKAVRRCENSGAIFIHKSGQCPHCDAMQGARGFKRTHKPLVAL